MPVVKKRELDTEIKLAINLYDLDKYSEEDRRKIAAMLDLQNPIKTDWDKNPEQSQDERAVVFKENLLSAAMVCDYLRARDKQQGVTATRLYLKRKEWSRIPATKVLTKIVAGKCILNAEVFSIEHDAVESAALDTGVFQFGE